MKLVVHRIGLISTLQTLAEMTLLLCYFSNVASLNIRYQPLLPLTDSLQEPIYNKCASNQQENGK